jgi:tetratricopeptide (TPR) repeat protein
MSCLLGWGETLDLFEALGDELGLHRSLDLAVEALESIASMAGLSGRAQIFGDALDDERLSGVRIDADKAAAILGFQEMKAATIGTWLPRIRAFVRERGIAWPWVEMELALAFEVVYLDSALQGRPLSIALNGGPTAPRADRPVEVGSFSVTQGEPVSEALARLAAQEEETRAARAAIEAMQRPRSPRGRVRDKTRETLARDITWYFRSKLLAEPIAEITRMEFGEGADRRKDVRGGICRAAEVLGQTSYQYNDQGEIILRDGLTPLSPEEATAVIRAAAADDGDLPALHAMTLEAVFAGNAVEALATADAALRVDPTDTVALVNRSGALRGLGRYDEALADAERAIEREPGNPGSLHAKSAALASLGRLHEAVELLGTELELHESLEADPRATAHVLMDRARMRDELGDPGGASIDLEAAVTADPENPRGYQARAAFRSRHVLPQEAAVDLEHASRLAPLDPGVWADLGAVLQEAGERVRARAALDRALEIDPSNSAALVNLGVLLADQGRRNRATEMFRRAVASDPANASARTNLALALLNANKPAEALGHARAATGAAPRFADAHNAVGSALLALDRADEAVDSFAAAVNLDVARFHHLHGLAVAYTRSGDIDRAIGTVAMLVSRFPERAALIAGDDDLAPLQGDDHRGVAVRALLRAVTETGQPA